MAQIVTVLGHLNVANRLTDEAKEAIQTYVDEHRALKIELRKSVSVSNGNAGDHPEIPTEWDVELRIDLASPRAGAHGGVECPHAQVTDALRHGGPAKWSVATDREAGGQSITRPHVNYDRKRVPETYALNSVETAQICRSTTALPHGVLMWLHDTLRGHLA